MAESGEARSGSAPLAGLVPMVFASDVRRSIEFYQQLGFELKKTIEDKDKGIVTWAWLQNGRASLMLARSARAMNPRKWCTIEPSTPAPIHCVAAPMGVISLLGADEKVKAPAPRPTVASSAT